MVSKLLGLAKGKSIAIIDHHKTPPLTEMVKPLTEQQAKLQEAGKKALTPLARDIAEIKTPALQPKLKEAVERLSDPTTKGVVDIPVNKIRLL
ncbi:MAG TPA: hypothetical protein DDW90_00380 [Cyanobacteria bacterium UBA9971]|nr:hypothetical protein [Cyanobacteria bacterium UBA9971]